MSTLDSGILTGFADSRKSSPELEHPTAAVINEEALNGAEPGPVLDGPHPIAIRI